MKSICLITIQISFFCIHLHAQDLPPGYWPLTNSQAILDKTQTIVLSTDLAGLSQGELAAIDKLNQVGAIFQSLYEVQRNPQSLSALQQLHELDKRLASPTSTQNLLTLYRLYQGPIAGTLDNRSEPFLPLDTVKTFDGLYPGDVTKAERRHL